jgi:hypothetical protein
MAFLAFWTDISHFYDRERKITRRESPNHRFICAMMVLNPAYGQATWLADRYDNPMPELALSPSQGSMNAATDRISKSYPRPMSELCPHHALSSGQVPGP